MDGTVVGKVHNSDIDQSLFGTAKEDSDEDDDLKEEENPEIKIMVDKESDTTEIATQYFQEKNEDNMKLQFVETEDMEFNKNEETKIEVVKNEFIPKNKNSVEMSFGMSEETPKDESPLD